jgi:hypothetical protein
VSPEVVRVGQHEPSVLVARAARRLGGELGRLARLDVYIGLDVRAAFNQVMLSLQRLLLLSVRGADSRLICCCYGSGGGRLLWLRRRLLGLIPSGLLV